MPPRIKRILKTGQTWLPWTRDIKFNAYNWLTRTAGMHVEREFRLLAALRPIHAALDIGANWGQSIEAIRYYARPEHLYSFEPNPPLARRLLRIFEGDKIVTINPYGLGDVECELPLYTPVYGKFIFDGATSFDREEARTFLNRDRMIWFSEESLKLVAERVPIRRLDDLHLKAEVVKIDVQGYEYEVLKGAKNTFSTCRPFTILENPSKDVLRFFDALGMNSFVLRGHMLHRGQTSGYNTLFMTEDHARLFEASDRWSVSG